MSVKVSELVESLGLVVFSGNEGLNNNVDGGYVSDLLSDVMGHASANDAWITLQTHRNVLAIASLKDIAAVILVKGLKPEEETIAHSNEEKIPVLGTSLDTFEISGQLYQILKK